MVSKKTTIFFFLIILSYAGCKKNKDTVAPVIDIVSPTANSSFEVHSSVEIQAHVVDDKKLDWVKFDIIDPDGKVVVYQVERSNLSANENLTVQLFIENIHLNSGNYFLRVVAFDGENKHSEFVDIIIQELPLKTDKTILLKTQLPAHMDTLDMNNIVHNVLNFNQNIVFAKANSYSGEIILAWNNPSKLVYLNKNDLSTENPINIPNANSPDLYHNITLDETSYHFFISTQTGYIHEIGLSGSNFLSFQIENNLRPYQLCTTENLIVVEEKLTNINDRFIKTYYKNSGIQVNSHYLDFNLIFIYALSNNEIILIGNENNQGVIAKYLINENTIITLANDLSPIHSACHIAGNSFAIGTNLETKIIQLTDFSISNQMIWAIGANHLIYNKAVNRLLSLNNYSYNSFDPSNSQYTSLPISNYQKLEFIYNK